ncbi:hypothetical protein BC828DRAFT_304308 [Blastocladiella britannica]|nr:hypothetical protein BC828DRAFT_304308 [Blastocladiella britannica]
MLLSFSETSTTVARHTALLGAGEKQEQLHNARLQALESQVASLTDELATSREQEQAAQRAMAALENEVAESRGLAQTVATQTAEAIARELDMMRSTVVAAAENRARQVVQDLRDNLSETRRLVHEARAAAVATAVSQVGPKVDEATADAIARLRAPLQAELREYADSAVATTIALVTATADAATANATSGATRLSGHGTNPTILADEHILALVRREVPQMLDERMDQTKKVMDAKWAEGDAKTKHLVRQTEGEILEMVRAMAKVIDKQHSHDQALQGIRADLERAVAEQQERTDAVSSRCDQLEATLSGQQRAHIASPALEQNKNEPPALSRLDVELLLEARDDAIHSQSKATARHINELDGVVQDIAKAVSEMHAAMVDRHMLGGLKAQLQSTQQAIGECRSWAEHAVCFFYPYFFNYWSPWNSHF